MKNIQKLEDGYKPQQFKFLIRLKLNISKLNKNAE